MKILQINAVSNIGSTGRTAKEIADYCNKNGHTCLTAYSEGEEIENGYRIGTYLEKKIHSLLSRVFGIQGYFSRRGTKGLISFIKEEKSDLIRIGNLHANFVNIPMLFRFIAKENIPTVITLDDCFFFTGKCTHYTISKCYKWKTGCNRCPRIKLDNKSWIFDRTKKMWNDKKKLYMDISRLAVVGVSEWITNEAKESILSSANYIQTIYNWIDTDLFKPIDASKIKKKLHLNDKFIILGVATEWNDHKGLSNFIQIANHLTENECIVLVGKMSKNTRLPHNIIHIEQTNNVSELVEYYSMADVFLQLSREETFGKVTAEALSCGTPIIVFNSTANPELVSKGCGYILENDSVYDVINKINNIKRNTKKYYSEVCRNVAIKRFSKDDRILDYINIFDKLTNYRGEK